MDDGNSTMVFESQIRQINEICSTVLTTELCENIDKRLKELSQLLPNFRNGFEVDTTFITSLGKVIDEAGMLMRNSEPNNVIPCITDCYRFCRNLCATCTRNQDVIHNAGTFVRSTHTFMLHICHTMRTVAPTEELLVLLRCAVQFLGNYSSGNKRNQLHIWESFREVFDGLLQIEDVKLQEYTLMVMHICLGDIAASFDDTKLDTTCWQLMSTAVQLSAQMESTNGLHVIEDAFKMTGFCENVFKKLTVHSKILVLEVVINILKRLPEDITVVIDDPMSGDGDVEVDDPMSGAVDTTTTVADIPAACNVQYIAADFIIQAHHIPMMNSQSSSESQALCTVHELECLCLASAHHKVYGCLQDIQQLVRVAVSILQSIEDIGRQGNNVFTNADKMSQQRNIDPDHPVFGLKRDLIRLLGNMAYKNKANQDLIRELNGIPLILDQTNIDGKNPFITQWSVFAIHNLTENNEDNRLYIAQLKLEGVANNQAVLNEMGLAAEKQGDKVVIKKKRKQ